MNHTDSLRSLVLLSLATAWSTAAWKAEKGAGPFFVCFANDSRLADAEKGPDPFSADTLTRVQARMRSIEKLLRVGNTSKETCQLQDQVASDLSRLIASLEQSANAGGSGRQQSRAGSSATAAGKGDAGSKGPPSGESSPGKSGQAPPDESSVANLLDRVWGQLPPQLQKQIQSPTHEQFLPKYETLIIEYYKRLAEGERR